MHSISTTIRTCGQRENRLGIRLHKTEPKKPRQDQFEKPGAMLNNARQPVLGHLFLARHLPAAIFLSIFKHLDFDKTRHDGTCFRV